MKYYSWTMQIEYKFQLTTRYRLNKLKAKLFKLYLSYIIVKKIEDSFWNKALSVKNIHIPYIADTTNIYTYQNIESLAISCSINQPMDLLLWDGSFCPISLFSLNKYLDGNAKNITCFLLRIATLIK